MCGIADFCTDGVRLAKAETYISESGVCDRLERKEIQDARSLTRNRSPEFAGKILIFPQTR